MRACSPSVGLAYCAALIWASLVGLNSAVAAELFVDNLQGNDAFDGRSSRPMEGFSGPFRTIKKALRRVRFGDSIILVNSGTPYYESISMEGSRFSGTAGFPFILEGNGAVLSGSRLVPPSAWQYVGQDVWRFRPFRKGFYQLLLNAKPLPEVRSPAGSAKHAELAEGQWTAWKGTVYYRSLAGPDQAPPDLPLEFAYEGCGIALVNVHGVVIRNLTVQHFREDGVNAHDGAKHVILENVKLLENGRAGLAASGTSLVGLTGSTVLGNRDVQILNAEVAQTEVDQSQLGDRAPFRIRGGHLLIDGQEVFNSSAQIHGTPRRPKIAFIHPDQSRSK